MPTDTASQTLEVHAPFDRVLAVIRDVQTQPEWVKEMLDRRRAREERRRDPGDRALPGVSAGGHRRLHARLHPPRRRDELVPRRGAAADRAGRGVHAAQAGKGGKRPEVTFDLTISHNLPLPGFIRRRVINGLVESNVTGLKAYLEA